MINKITFLLQHKKNTNNHLFSKQLKNLQSNQLIVGFISIIYSSFAWGLRTGGAEAPEAARPEGPKVPEAARPEGFAPHALNQRSPAEGKGKGQKPRSSTP